MNNNQLINKKENKIIEFEKNISDSVQNRISTLANEGRLNLPQNYSVGNALNSAWLIIQGLIVDNKPALLVCTRDSIAQALLDMSIMGLNPAKKHGYFIAYGNRLTWFTSYFGKCAVVKRLKGITTEPIATLIYKGDKVELGHTELGEEIIVKHETSWEGKTTGEIVGVYATVKQGDIMRSAVMTISEVKEAWMKNPSLKNKREHIDFAGEFAKRTVINRLTKMIIQTSNDDDLLAQTFIENEGQHFAFDNEESVQEKIETEANTGEIIDIGEVDQEEKVVPLEEKEVTSTPEPLIINAEKVVVEQKKQPETKQTSLFNKADRLF